MSATPLARALPPRGHDLRVVPTMLGLAGTGLVVGGAGSALSALIRTHAVPWAGVAQLAAKSAGVGAAIAGALLITDHLTGGRIGASWHGLRQVLGDTHQLGVLLHHPDKPWLVFTAKGAHTDAENWQARIWGPGTHLDDGADAFRHSFGSALFTERLMQRGMSRDSAVQLTEEAGRAHEADGDDNLHHGLSSAMDLNNNAVGAALIGSGRAADGSWLSPQQVADMALAAVRDGRVVRLDPAATQLVPTGPDDLPPNLRGAH